MYSEYINDWSKFTGSLGRGSGKFLGIMSSPPSFVRKSCLPFHFLTKPAFRYSCENHFRTRLNLIFSLQNSFFYCNIFEISKYQFSKKAVHGPVYKYPAYLVGIILSEKSLRPMSSQKNLFASLIFLEKSVHLSRNKYRAYRRS